MNATKPLLQVIGVSKSFPGVCALSEVSMYLDAGEVLAIVGENGAGKSTLMKIIGGLYTPDSGEMRLAGRPVVFRSVREAAAAGISLIHQELNLADNLDVTANLFLGRERTFCGILRRRAMHEAAAELLRRVGLSPDLRSFAVGSLAPGQKQLVEIARALGLHARILIMDEPTSSLTQKETDRLYDVIAGLKAAGVGVVYISHRLAEVKRCADRVTVLRDGRNAGELAREEINPENIIRLMVGRDLKGYYPRSSRVPSAGPPALEIRDLVYEGGPPTPIHLRIRAGEIVGMAGLVGAGRTELAEAVFGIRRILRGEVRVGGQPFQPGTPRRAIRAGMLLVPEDRRKHGLVQEESIGFNLALPNFDLLGLLGVRRFSRERTLGKEQCERLKVKSFGLSQPCSTLSGGNQQKIVLGKWLMRRMKILILDEPTRGVDVGARGEIYALMDQLASQGIGIWMISSDLEEILGMSDRVAVLYEGKLQGELGRNELSEEAVMILATGGPAPARGEAP